MSISRTVSGPEVAARWCKDALNRLLFCLSNRRYWPQLCVLRHLSPDTADQIISATSQQFFGLDKDSDGDSPIQILNSRACECDLLAQEVILAHSATPGCCFDNLVSMAPNCVRQCISDMSACKQHADPERVRSLLQQSDDMPVAAWCVTHAKSAV